MMIRKPMIGLCIAILIVLGLVAATGYYYQPKKEVILNFILKHPDKSAIKLVYNGQSLVEHQGDKMMPLASTVKLILAIEYAYQATNGQLNPNKLIPLTELEQFYIPNTDGGAHPAWLERTADKVSNDSISIREITKGT